MYRLRFRILFKWKKNICEKCRDGCATCSDSENCGYCDFGYFVKNPETNKGDYDTERKSCLKGCERCFDKNSCVSCKEGYYSVRGSANEENLECKQCSEGCVESKGSTHCLKCAQGYYLSNTGHASFCLKLDNY